MIPEGFPLWTLLGFIFAAAFYWRAWRPFMQLPCHQDAGWHSYWAAFRHQGVSLERQENVLIGCARLGNMFLYVLWFAMLGKGNPDLVSRKVYRALNIVSAALVALTVFHQQTNGGTAGLLVAVAFLALMAIPTLGVHYETTERSVLLLNIGILALALEVLGNPSENTYMLMGVLVFLQILSAMFFKITQLGDYFFIWLALYFSNPTMDGLLYSFGAGLSALTLFILVLASLGLLKKENMGILGYFSNTRSEPDDNEGKSRRLTVVVNERLSNSALKRPALAMIRCLGENVADILIRRAENVFTFLPLIGWSTRGFVLLGAYGLLTGRDDLHFISSFWLAGALCTLLVQGRFFPFHFIPLILPMAILSGIGAHDLIQGIQDGEILSVLILMLVATVFAFDVRFLLFKRQNLALDIRYWPEKLRGIFIKNRIAEEASAYLNTHTHPDDWVLVWGTMPQIYVASDRRCPVNWLSTSSILMNQILPSWKEILAQRLKDDPPAYILLMDNDHQDFAELISQTGHKYELDTFLGSEKAPLYCLR